MTHEAMQPELRHNFPDAPHAPQLRADKLRAAIEARRERDAQHENGSLAPDDSAEWITLAPPTDLAQRIADHLNN